MSWPARFGRWLATPIRACVSLTRAQVRSLYSVAMLAGIMALSIAAGVLLFFAEGAVPGNMPWFKLAAEILRYIFALIFVFSLFVALIVFGADYLKAKWGDKEFAAGRDDEQ